MSIMAIQLGEFRRTNSALFLAVSAVVLSNIATYFTPGWIKYILLSAGSFLGIVAAIVLWQIRKPYVLEIESGDWIEDPIEKNFKVFISYSKHKRPTPTISIERFSHDARWSGFIRPWEHTKGYWTSINYDNYRVLEGYNIELFAQYPIPEEGEESAITKIRVIIK